MRDPKQQEDWVAEKVASTMFVVEATYEEMSQLWCEYAKGSHWTTRKPEDRQHWAQHGMGSMQHVADVTIFEDGGTPETMPIWVSFSWYDIDGCTVMFYEATSQVVDHRLVEKYVDGLFETYPTYDKGYRKAHCNATNFGHCIGAIRDMNITKGVTP